MLLDPGCMPAIAPPPVRRAPFRRAARGNDGAANYWTGNVCGLDAEEDNVTTGRSVRWFELYIGSTAGISRWHHDRRST